MITVNVIDEDIERAHKFEDDFKERRIVSYAGASMCPVACALTRTFGIEDTNVFGPHMYMDKIKYIPIDPVRYFDYLHEWDHDRIASPTSFSFKEHE